MLVIGYIREPQEGQDCTLEEQQSAIRAYCQANSLELKFIVEDRADQASIGLLYRSYGHQLQAAEDAHLVFANYRRSFESYDDFAVSETTLTGHRNILHLIDWNARSDQPAWPMLMHILSDVRARQVERHLEPKIRFSSLGKLHQKKVRQKFLWSVNADVPWCYARVPAHNGDLGTHLKINLRENYILSMIAQLCRSRYTMKKIALTFNKALIPVPRQPGIKWTEEIARRLHWEYRRFRERHKMMSRYFKPSHQLHCHRQRA